MKNDSSEEMLTVEPPQMLVHFTRFGAGAVKVRGNEENV